MIWACDSYTEVQTEKSVQVFRQIHQYGRLSRIRADEVNYYQQATDPLAESWRKIFLFRKELKVFNLKPIRRNH